MSPIRSEYRISLIDCAAEEQMIRIAFRDMVDIRSRDFDLKGGIR